MHQYHELAADFGIGDNDAESFAGLLQQVLETSGDSVAAEDGTTLTRSRWRIFPEPPHEVVEFTQVALFEGLLAAHNRGLRLTANRIQGGLQLGVH